MADFFHLVYLSSAREPFSKEELQGILRKSRANNERLSVTGLLLYQEGNIIQVLEGEKSAVKGLYDKIQKDPRHGGFIKLLEEGIPERQFEGWAMAFRDVGDESHELNEGYSDFMNQSEASPGVSSKAQRLLNLFRSNYAATSPIRGLRVGSQDPSRPGY